MLGLPGDDEGTTTRASCVGFADDCNARRAVAMSAAMALRFSEMHASADPELLNAEWLVLENLGPNPFNTRGCGITVSRRGSKKRSELGIMDPGFLIKPGEKMRLVTGNPATKAHGEPPPEDDVKNYFLFLPKLILTAGAGTLLTLTLRGLPVCKGEFAPDAAAGVTPPA